VTYSVIVPSFFLSKLLFTDDTTYDTVFQTTQGDTLILRVHVPLASSFASFCPAMTLAGARVRHKWVQDRTMKIIGYEPIESERSWKASGLSLGQVVHAVVKHLQLNPPEILEITDRGLQAIQPATSPFHSSGGGNKEIPRSSKHGNDTPPSYEETAVKKQNVPKIPPAPDVPLPPIPRDFFDLLDGKSIEGLERLLKNELDFLMMVHKLPIFQEIKVIAISKAEESKKLAKDNLRSEHRIASARGEAETMRTLLEEKITAFQALEAEQNKMCAPTDWRQIVAKLKEAEKEAFDESETFAEEWVDDGANNVDDFMKEFIAKRKIHHARSAKVEVLKRQQQDTYMSYR